MRKIDLVKMNATPVAIKGYTPNGDDKMFVFAVDGNGHKLYAGKAKDVPIRVAIATVEIENPEVAEKYGEQVILIDKVLSKKNGFFNRKTLLAAIQLQNSKSYIKGDTFVDNLEGCETVEETYGEIEGAILSQWKYGQGRTKKAMGIVNKMLLKGTKKAAKQYVPADAPKSSADLNKSSQKNGLEEIDIIDEANFSPEEVIAAAEQEDLPKEILEELKEGLANTNIAAQA